MKRNPKQELMGVVDCGWDTRRLLLPLDMAHQLQKIMAHAVKLDNNYENNDRKFYYMQDYTAPTVNVVEPTMLILDATGMTNADVIEWKKEVDESLKENPDAKAKDILSPKSWLAMRGE